MTSTPDDSWRPTPPSWDAMSLMGLLLRRGGGGMRIAPLRKRCDLTEADLAAALNELYERTWIDIVLRGPDARLPESLPARFRHVRRIATTRCGRIFYPRYWVY